MAIIIEAIYQSGVLKPLTPLPQIKENQKVRLIVNYRYAPPLCYGEQASLIEAQKKHRIQLPPDVAREIGDSPGYELWETTDDVE